MVDGKIIIERPETKPEDLNSINSINNIAPISITESDSKKISTMSFKKINHSNKWTEEETRLFYEAIKLFGVNFCFLEIILKPRKRREIKNKYMKE